MLNVKRIVLKIGTSVLLDKEKNISMDMVGKLARQVRTIKEKGIDTIIVSSGAIASGMEALALKKKPKEIEKRQALASIGQIKLMNMYMDAFEKERLKIGQVLLTHEDIKSKTRCLNLMNTLNSLLSMKIIPVINENDALSFKEIRFGDNDNLSALIAQITDSDLLVLLSDVDGLCDKDPQKYPDARIISVVEKIDDKIERLAFDIENIALRVINGEDIGTLFQPESKIGRNKWWTAFAYKIKGKVWLDEGAKNAILYNGKSLLPSGVVKIEGDFSRGDCVELHNADGQTIARGITNYSSTDVNKIKGLKSVDIERKLGYKYAEEIVHRDNMVVI